MSVLCFIGWHKWVPDQKTIKRVDKYTIEADISCTRCGTEAHGTCESGW